MSSLFDLEASDLLSCTWRRGKPETNNRIIATPAWHEPFRPYADARDLPALV